MTAYQGLKRWNSFLIQYTLLKNRIQFGLEPVTLNVIMAWKRFCNEDNKKRTT